MDLGDPPDRLRLHPAHADAAPRPASPSTAADIRLPPLSRVGYVRGAADRVPEALLAIGVPVEILTERDLDARRPLALRRDPRRQPRLRDRPGAAPRERPAARLRARGRPASSCSTSSTPFLQGGFAPYTMEIARPHDRVTDETAKVTVLDPAEPRLHDAQRDRAARTGTAGCRSAACTSRTPGRPEYTPLLAMADPGGPEQKGGLLVARARQGPLRLHGPRLLPPASGRRARRVPTARQSARVEVSAEPERSRRRETHLRPRRRLLARRGLRLRAVRGRRRPSR